MWVMAALVGLQEDHAKLSQAGAEPGLGRCFSLRVAHYASRSFGLTGKIDSLRLQ
jgi:hypothetical protein